MFRCVAPCARGGRPASARAVSGRYHRRRGRRDAPCRGRVGLQPRGARVGPGGGAARVRQGRQRRPRGESQGPGLSACPFGVTLLPSLLSSPFSCRKALFGGNSLGTIDSDVTSSQGTCCCHAQRHKNILVLVLFVFFLRFFKVLYPVGPGPSPARIARSLVPTGMWPKLAMSIVVDTIGCTSYAVPVSSGAVPLRFFSCFFSRRL